MDDSWPIVLKMLYYFHLTPNAAYKHLGPYQDEFWDAMRKYGKNWEKIRTNDWENNTYSLDWRASK
jgi:hypothetical protein